MFLCIICRYVLFLCIIAGGKKRAKCVFVYHSRVNMYHSKRRRGEGEVCHSERPLSPLERMGQPAQAKDQAHLQAHACSPSVSSKSLPSE